MRSILTQALKNDSEQHFNKVVALGEKDSFGINGSFGASEKKFSNCWSLHYIVF